MKVAIHQPNYLPWIGFFDKMDQVDAFVILDTAMYTKAEFINRNKVKTPEGWKWLTVPVKGKRGPINQLLIDNTQNWRRRHWMIIHNAYKNTPFWHDYCDGFEYIYHRYWDKVVDLNMALIHYLKELLGINTDVVTESSLNKNFGSGNMRNINITKEIGGTIYVSGTGARVYNDEAKFDENDIQLVYQNFQHPIYPQRWGKFEPNLSMIDMLFNCGPETMSIVRKGRRDPNGKNNNAIR